MLIKPNNFVSTINFYYKYCSSFMATPTTNSAAAAVAVSSTSRFYWVRKFSENGVKFGDYGNPVLRVKGCGFSKINGSKFSENVNGWEDGNVVGLNKARVFAPYSLKSPLLRDPEEVGFRRVVESDGDSGSRILNGDGNVRGSSVGITDRRDDLAEKIVVAVDVDEVLGNFVSTLNRFIADRYSSNHSISEYHVYEFFKIWKCSRNEADVRVHEFFKTPYFKKGIQPIPGALEALQKLSRFCDLSIVTSRQNIIKDHTIEWIEMHYPGIFQEIHFGNHFALDGQSKPKSDICRELGAKVLIDDNPRYAIECAKEGISVLLFDYENSYPWSKMESLDEYPLVTKVQNWEEVEHHMRSTSVIS